jgi:hypothetical protein
VIYLAGYIAPGRATDKLTRAVTGSRFSHVELTDGQWWLAASWRDGGVRAKRIREDPGHWVKTPLRDGEMLWERMAQHIGARYDFWGAVLGPTLGINPNNPSRWFCSELFAASRGLPRPWTYCPGRVMALELKTEPRTRFARQ